MRGGMQIGVFENFYLTARLKNPLLAQLFGAFPMQVVKNVPGGFARHGSCNWNRGTSVRKEKITTYSWPILQILGYIRE